MNKGLQISFIIAFLGLQVLMLFIIKLPWPLQSYTMFSSERTLKSASNYELAIKISNNQQYLSLKPQVHLYMNRLYFRGFISRMKRAQRWDDIEVLVRRFSQKKEIISIARKEFPNTDSYEIFLVKVKAKKINGKYVKTYRDLKQYTVTLQ